MDSKERTQRLVTRAIFIAIIALQTMVPALGYIPLGFVSLTIIHITVIVAAIMMGPVDGMLIGFVWGALTVVRAFMTPTSPLDTIIFTNPIVSVIPRVLVGLVAGLVFRTLYRKFENLTVASIVAAIFGTLTNTFLVVTLMGTLYTSTLTKSYNVSSAGLVKVLMGIIGSNGVVEVGAAVVITPLIIQALSKTRKEFSNMYTK
ncbi:ECF transporter S component [Pediococcus claussenii]|uniref:Integral membrane protein n=1 Tax=Pediococcus claussenii (strain ATCC BAA-344 / DSM 14800 / JCM 18046 / KCTC 3811 / LMG 21948 / P06) TaxID=701521 RepID=G8PA85_PEDCP|nr:ECF transporter S component [Pediococcus claussenii]AEV94524.1 hypothetical protein PECL_201 [Pediococcus claussenii ATCC BAA-344]ANZ69742.1 hypothetical protein AYR57_05160 [Pediococcus claussenii]ANZ71559.1 hypothetical protein AYR58_05165 [Pediococcus claussenii]